MANLYQIHTDDIRWAIAYAGCAKNNNLAIQFISNNEYILELNNRFVDRSGTPISISPDTINIEELQIREAQIRKVEMENLHGVPFEEDSVFLELQGLANAQLELQENRRLKSGVYYPELKGSTISKPFILIQKEEFSNIAKGFGKEDGAEPVLYTNLEDVFNLNCLGVVGEADFELFHVLNAQYTGLTSLRIPGLLVLTSVPPNYTVNWLGLLPVNITESEPSLISRSRSWKERVKYNFDFNRYLKDKINK